MSLLSPRTGLGKLAAVTRTAGAARTISSVSLGRHNLQRHPRQQQQQQQLLLLGVGPEQCHFMRAFQSTDSTSSSSSKDGAADAATGQEGDAAEVPEAEQQLRAENDELKAKLEDLTDKYRRSIAESDNMRKRLTKQIDDAKVFGIQGFCKDLLEVADVLGKAVRMDAPETGAGGVADQQYLRDMHEGLRLTESQLLQVFRRHGLEQVNPLNERFDPNRHEALFQIPNPNVEPNTVLDVQTLGYSLHGRTIRPAKVGVSKK